MLTKTHFVIALALLLVLISSINYKIIFSVVLIVSTLLADIDSQYSYLGKYKILRPFQWFVKHRGIFHSFTLLVPLTAFFVFFLPTLAFPFFLGYGVHLFADSFTKEGIQPFYPLKKTYAGKISTGGKTEIVIFSVFVVINLFLILIRAFSMF